MNHSLIIKANIAGDYIFQFPGMKMVAYPAQYKRGSEHSISQRVTYTHAINDLVTPKEMPKSQNLWNHVKHDIAITIHAISIFSA